MNICKLLERMGLVCCHVWGKVFKIKGCEVVCSSGQRAIAYTKEFRCKKCPKIKSKFIGLDILA